MQLQEQKKIRARARAFCKQRGCSLPGLIAEALEYWLEAVGEALTEIEQENGHDKLFPADKVQTRFSDGEVIN